MENNQRCHQCLLTSSLTRELLNVGVGRLLSSAIMLLGILHWRAMCGRAVEGHSIRVATIIVIYGDHGATVNVAQLRQSVWIYQQAAVDSRIYSAIKTIFNSQSDWFSFTGWWRQYFCNCLDIFASSIEVIGLGKAEWAGPGMVKVTFGLGKNKPPGLLGALSRWSRRHRWIQNEGMVHLNISDDLMNGLIDKMSWNVKLASPGTTAALY